jgi:hypothetical protein
VIIVASSRDEGLPAGIEHRLAAFTELVATAIANTQAREELPPPELGSSHPPMRPAGGSSATYTTEHRIVWCKRS